MMLAKLSGKPMTAIVARVRTPANASGAPVTLSDLGLSTNRDGTFTLDTKRLDAVLKRDPAGTGAMFTNGLFGVFATFDKLSRTVASSTDPSSLGGSISRLTTQQTSLTTQKTDLTTKQEDLRTKLVSRFASLNTNVSASKSTLSFLQQQVAAWTGKTA